MPITYIARMRERFHNFPYKWATNHEAPWTPLKKPLRESRLALISSGGFYLKTQPPFEERDASIRLVPKDTDVKDLLIYHHAYRDDDVDRDPNCVLPLDRLREFEAAGVIGELAANAITFVNLFSPRREIQERAPLVLAELQKRAVDVALLVPV